MSIPTVGPAASGPTVDGCEHDARRMLAVVHRLAAEEFKGRRVGTPGGRAAAAWLATHLESLGVQVHTDTFRVAGAVRELAATPVLRWRTPMGERELVHRRDFAEHLASAFIPEPAEGAWVFEESFHAERVGELASAGVAGIVLPRGTDEAGWMPKMIAGPAACGLPVVSVRTDLWEQMSASVQAVAASVPLRTFDVTGTNVHGTFRPPAPDGLSVLLTAHFDGVGDDPEIRFPAAADNASGVAVVMQAAARLHRILAPQVGLAVALLDAEEAGAHGSAHHAARLPPDTIVINLDGAARLHEAAAVEAGGPAHALLAALDQAGRQTGVPLRAQAMPSDNRRYAAKGLAAIGLGMGMPGYQTPAETPDRIEAKTLLAAADLLTATVVRLAAA